MRRTTVFGVYDHGQYGAVERVSDHLAVPPPYQPRQRYWKIVAKRVVLAAGASERPIAFAGNDRPGVMLAGAVRTYLNRYAATPSSRLVVFTNNDDGWRTASAALDAGVAIEAIVDLRADARERLPTSLKKAVRIFAGARVVRTKGTRAIRESRLSTQADAKSRSPAIASALPVVGIPYFILPAILATSRTGATISPRSYQIHAPLGMIVAGAAGGAMRLADCLTTGSEAGARAASDCGFAAHRRIAAKRGRTRPSPSRRSGGSTAKGKAFVDLQNDVTVKDVALAKREGFQSVEHLKRYTTLGMATDQGKIGGVVGLAIMAELMKQTDPGGGNNDLSPTLYACRSRSSCRTSPWQGFPTDAACRHRTNGLSSKVPSWWKRAHGCAPNIIPARGMATGLKPLAAKYAPYAPRSASVMYRHWAGSTCKAPMPAFSSIVYTPTCSRRCRLAKRATG